MPADVPPPPDVHFISYVYSTRGVFYHGTISDADGTPKSTWTLSEGSKKIQFDQPIDQETFSFLWNGIADYKIFKTSVIQGANTPVDFDHFQIISISFRVNGRPSARNYQISPVETDPEYKLWIEKLHVPWKTPKKETFFDKIGKTLRLTS